MPPVDENTTEETATQEITVAGLTFTADAPYKEGHPLTAGEAVALNQTYSENLRNNFAGRVKKAQTAALTDAIAAWTAAGKEGPAPTEAPLSDKAIAALRSEWDEYVSTYEFNGRRVARQQGDPIDREARKMARAVIVDHCKSATDAEGKARPIDTKSFTEEKWGELISQVLEKYPDIRENAKVRVEANKAVLGRQIDFAA